MYLSGFVIASTANVLSGSVFEFLKRPSRISVGAWVGQVNLNAGNTFTFQIGDTVIARDAQIFGDVQVVVTSGASRSVVGPKFPEDFMVQQEPGLAGDRLVLSISRALGTIAWAVIITEVA